MAGPRIAHVAWRVPPTRARKSSGSVRARCLRGHPVLCAPHAGLCPDAPARVQKLLDGWGDSLRIMFQKCSRNARQWSSCGSWRICPMSPWSETARGLPRARWPIAALVPAPPGVRPWLPLGGKNLLNRLSDLPTAGRNRSGNASERSDWAPPRVLHDPPGAARAQGGPCPARGPRWGRLRRLCRPAHGASSTAS